MERFRGWLVFKAHRRVYHSTLGLRVIKKKKERSRKRKRVGGAGRVESSCLQGGSVRGGSGCLRGGSGKWCVCLAYGEAAAAYGKTRGRSPRAGIRARGCRRVLAGPSSRIGTPRSRIFLPLPPIQGRQRPLHKVDFKDFIPSKYGGLRGQICTTSGPKLNCVQAS